MAAEASKEYQSSLDELNFNSKLHINVLTMLAEENINYAENIVQVIENHIHQATPEKKLPTLYLMDSIMKNLRNTVYPNVFAQNIVTTFVAVFEKVDEKKRQSLYKLRQTWNDIFTNSKLYAIDVRISQIDPAWPITSKPADAGISSIHVNPKFLNQDDDKSKAQPQDSVHSSADSSRIQKEEEQLRQELIEEEIKRKDEEQLRARQKELERKLFEEEQEKKMREELLAKQQELMRLQQQRLELELESTRKALLEKERELNKKNEEDHHKVEAEKREKQRKEEEIRQRAEREMRKNMEAEFKREKDEAAKKKVELERKRKVEEEERRNAVARDPRLKGKGKLITGHHGKSSGNNGTKRVISPGKKMLAKKEHNMGKKLSSEQKDEGSVFRAKSDNKSTSSSKEKEMKRHHDRKRDGSVSDGKSVVFTESSDLVAYQHENDEQPSVNRKNIGNISTKRETQDHEDQDPRTEEVKKAVDNLLAPPKIIAKEGNGNCSSKDVVDQRNVFSQFEGEKVIKSKAVHDKKIEKNIKDPDSLQRGESIEITTVEKKITEEGSNAEKAVTRNRARQINDESKPDNIVADDNKNNDGASSSSSFRDRGSRERENRRRIDQERETKEKDWERRSTRASSRIKDREFSRRKGANQSNSPPPNDNFRSAKFKESPPREYSRGSKYNDQEFHDRNRRSRNYRPHRPSNSPSSEEEEQMLSLRPKRYSPQRSGRNTRRSRGSTTPERLIPRKVTREDDYHRGHNDRESIEQRNARDTFEKSCPIKRTIDDKQSDDDLNKGAPPNKKVKEDAEILEPHSQRKKSEISSDIADLFGTEDVDYRQMAPQHPTPSKPPHLQHQLDFNSPQQKGWAKFKENRPQEFPFAQPRRISIDVNSPMVKQMSSPALESPGFHRTDSTSIINIADLENILQQADNQLLRGKMSHQQYQELQKQLKELQRIQTMMAEMKKSQRLKELTITDSSSISGFREMKPPPMPPILIEIEDKKGNRTLLMNPPSGQVINSEPNNKQPLLGSPPSKPHLSKQPKHALLEAPNRLIERNPSPDRLKSHNQLMYEDRSQDKNERASERQPLLDTPDGLLDSPRKGLLGDSPKDISPQGKANKILEDQTQMNKSDHVEHGADAESKSNLSNQDHKMIGPIPPPPKPPGSLLKRSVSPKTVSREFCDDKKPTDLSSDETIVKRDTQLKQNPQDLEESFLKPDLSVSNYNKSNLSKTFISGKFEKEDSPSFSFETKNRKPDQIRSLKYERDREESFHNIENKNTSGRNFSDQNRNDQDKNNYRRQNEGSNFKLRDNRQNTDIGYYGEELVPELSNMFRRNSTDIDTTPLYDNKKYYVAEYDKRWEARANRYRERKLLNSFELVINSQKRYPMQIGGQSKLSFGGQRRNVYIDKETREVMIDGKSYTYVGSPERSIVLSGKKYYIQVQGMLKRFWIDGHQFQLHLDAPEETITIASKEHTIKLDTAVGYVILDGEELCLIELTNPKTVNIDGNKRLLQFTPPSRKILIDGKLCELNLSKKFPTIMVTAVERGVRFDGQPRIMVIDDKEYEVAVERPSIIKLGSGKPYTVAFGGPGHEVIIDELWYEVKFNHPPAFLQIGQRKLKIELPGPPPDVKILGIVKTPKDISASVFSDEHNEKIRRFKQYDHNFDLGSLEESIKATGGSQRSRFEASTSSSKMKEIPSLFSLPLIKPTSSFMGQQQLQEQSMPPIRPPPPINMNIPRAPFPPVGPGIRGLPFIPPQRLPPPPPPPPFKPSKANVQIPQMDVGDLFSKLVQAGIINRRKSTEKIDIPVPSTSNSCDSPVPSEIKEEGTEVEQKPQVKPTDPAPVILQDKVRAETPPLPESLEVVPDLTDLSSDRLKKKYTGVVQKLFIGIQCNSCGTRFKDQSDKYKEHLDWHFRQNKREKEDSRVIRNRRWFYSITDWVQFEEIGDIEDRFVSNYFENMLQSIHNVIGNSGGEAPTDALENTAETCPIASTTDEENVCVICEDPFEQFYDDDEEEWHLKDAIRIAGKTYHPVCYEDAKDEDGNVSGSVETPDDGAALRQQLPDPITNPLAYLTALSEQAKQTNQSIDTVAKLHVKPEPMDTTDSSVGKADAPSGSTLKKVVSEPSLNSLFNIVNAPASIKTEQNPLEKEQSSIVFKSEVMSVKEEISSTISNNPENVPSVKLESATVKAETADVIVEPVVVKTDGIKTEPEAISVLKVEDKCEVKPMDTTSIEANKAKVDENIDKLVKKDS